MKLRHFFAALAVLLFPVVSFAQSAPVSCPVGQMSCWFAVSDNPSISGVAIYGSGDSTDGASTNVFQDLNPATPGDPVSTSNYIFGDHNSLSYMGSNTAIIGTNNSVTGTGTIGGDLLGDMLIEGYYNTVQSDISNISIIGQYNSVTGSEPFGQNWGVTIIGGTNTADTSTGNIFGVANYLLGSTQGNIVGYENTMNLSTGSSILGNYDYMAGNDAVIAGSMSTNTADYGAVLGSGSENDAVAGTVLGSGASLGADATNSVAVGSGSYTDDANVVVIGGRRIEQVAAGFQATDGVNFGQLSGVTSFLGGGAGFDAAGNPIAPMYVLTNPYTPGDYSTVGDAISALDKAIGEVQSTPGPQGPAGANGTQGPAGPQGPQGPAGTGNGSGTDPLAVHYDDASLKSVTLGRQPNANGNQTANAVGGPVIVHNLAPGVAGTDAANVDQVQEALTSAETYTDIKATQVLNQANAYTDFRVGQLDGRIKRAIAIGTAQAQMVATYAGADPSSANRVAVGTGWEGGYGAMAVGYQHVSVESKHRITWNVGASISGGDGSVGGGVGFSW